jgi:hypothetical protein
VSKAEARFRLIVILACALVSFAIYFPGRLDPDSTTQLQEALSGRFTDWHPPIMAALWRVLINVAPGPAPLLALHLALYSLGVWAIWDAAARISPSRQYLPLVAAAHPLMLVMLSAIQKDVGLTVTLIAAFGLIFRQRALDLPVSVARSVLIAILFAYAALVRWNGALAVAPLLLWWLAPRWGRAAQIIAATALFSVAALPVAGLVDYGLLRSSRTHVGASLQLFDIAGIAHFSGDRRLLDLHAGCYTPYFWDPLDTPPCGDLFRRLASTDQGARAVNRRWLAAIADHPLAYAEHRLSYFNSSTAFLVSPTARCEAAPTYSKCDEPRSRQIIDDFIKKNLLYWPCIWLAIGAWLLIRGRSSPPARALAWSAVLYGFGYLLIGVATDWRYHLWTTVAAAMALAVHFATDREARGQWKELLLAIALIAIPGYAARLLFAVAG